MVINAKTRRVIGVICGLIGVILLCIYLGVAFYFQERFFPKTTINGVSFGKSQKNEVMKGLETQHKHYGLDVLGRDLQTGEETVLFHIAAADVDVTSVINVEDIDFLLKSQNSFLWPARIWKNYDYQVQGDVSYNAEKLVAFLDKQPAFQEESTQLPVDAYIKGYSEEAGTYVLEAEIQGTRMKNEVAVDVIKESITNGLQTVNLAEHSCYIEPTVLSSDESLQQNVLRANKCLETEITYDWNGQEVLLTGDQIKEWIVLENNKLKLDQTAVEEFVKQNAAEFDTYGKNRVFRTTLGYDLTLPSGAFGWLTDCEAEVKELTELIEAGTVCEREPVYACKAPWKGVNDIGNSYVEVDMTHQHLYLYQKGVLVLESDFVSGDMSKNYNTPEGVFGVTYKTTNAILRGGDYAEYVSYWMPYHGNYGMHDATWRTEFGGDIYLTNGSHGCINLPLDKAGEIYNQVSEGFPVICYYYPPGVLPEPEVYEPDDEDE